MIVSAPVAGDIAKSLASLVTNARRPPLSLPKRVATKPGWRQFAVTSVPRNRRASSRVNKMLQSFERL